MSWFDELAAASGVDKQSDYGQAAAERDAAEAAARANYDTAWNYLTHLDREGFADYTNRNYNYRDIPFLGQIIGHTADSMTQGVADIAQFLNFDSVGNYLNDKAQAGEARLPAMTKPELSLDYVTDPNGLASAGASVIGSMLAMAPAAMLVPGGAVATAARAGAAIPKVGGFMKGFLPEALRWGATGPVEAMMEGGNTERQLLEKGVSRKDADAAARKVFFDNALLLSGTNALEGGLLRGVKLPKGDNVLGRLGGAAERAAERNVFARGALNTARFAPAAAAEVGLNGFEEGAQQGIQDAALGQGADSWQQFLNPAQWTDEQWDAAKMGVAGTLPLMAGIGGIRYAHNRAGIKRIGAEDFGNDPLKNGETALQTDAVNHNILNQQAAADQEFALPSQTSDSSTRKQDKAVKKTKNTMPSYAEQLYEISDEVSNTAATDDTKARLNTLAHDYKQQFGEKLMVTSMKRSGNGESWHDEGKAFDVAGGGLETNKNGEREWLMKRGQELGLTPLDEYASPSDHATGGHIHFSNHDDENKPAIVGEEESKKSSGTLTKSSGNQQYDAWIEKSAAAHGVPANLLSSLLEVESGYNPEAKSSAGAIGIAQFMPETAKEYGIDPTNPEQAIEGAAQFLQQKYEKYGNWHQALEAYNGGDGNVGISETKAYADKVLNGAGKLDTQALDKKTAAIPDSEEIPDFIQQGTEDSAEFYDQFAQDVLASATDISQIDALGSMMKRNGKFNNTEKNRKLLAEMFPSEMMDYYNRIFEPRNKDLIMRDIAENLKQQAIAEKKLDLYESLEDALRTNDKPAIETLVKRYGKSQTGKRAAEISSEKVATPNLTKAQEQGRKLISLMRANNIPFNEKAVERAVSHGDPKVNRYMTGELSRAGVDAQNIVGYPTTMMARPNVSHPIKKNIASAQQTPQPLMLAMAPIANTVPQRQQQARAIRQIATESKQVAEQKEKVSHFDTSDFTHTKTGKKITAAKISNKVDRDTYVKIRDIAKKHGGRYNPFARRFFFRDSAGRDAFTQEAEQSVFRQEQVDTSAHNEMVTPKEKKSQTETNTNTVKAVFSDKGGSMKGGIANGVMTVWQKPGGLPKKEFSFTVTLDEVEKALKGGANSRYTIHQLAKGKIMAATEAWIEGSKTKALRDTRRDHWENNILHGKWSTLQAREIDSAARVIEKLYEQATGHKPQSLFEKRAEEKAKAKEKKSQTETNTKTESKGKKIVSKSGKTATVITDSGKELKVTYKLVPASRVVTSHTADGLSVNKKYPQELQPRDRQRVAMRQQITKMANELHPEDLAEGRNLNQGAPIVREDGVVLNGNGRAIAIQTAQNGKKESAKKYKMYLVEHAEEFGFKPEDIKGMKAPMLVRMVENIDESATQDIINSTTGGSRLGASEQAKVDAKKIGLIELEAYVPNDKGDLTTAANRDFLQGIMNKIIGTDDMNAYLDEHGNINADGIQRIKRALFQAAYGNDELIAKMAESTDDAIKNVTNALTNVAPIIARVNAKMKQGEAYKHDLAKTTSDAVNRYNHLRQTGEPLEHYLSQQSMFSEYEDTPEVVDIMKALDRYKRSANKLSQFFRRVGEIIEAQGNPQEEFLFKGVQPLSLKQIINTAYSEVENGGKGKNLFDMEPAEQSESNKKAADNGGYKLADGYTTESGKPLSEADEKEFIIKPDGTKDFGKISQDISRAVKDQSGIELKPGKIRLRVGNTKSGLVHAKEHESQAISAGYNSIEELVEDVASSFDKIYMRTTPDTGSKTYSLVKSGDKRTGKMNGVAPVYFELESDGSGNYYIVITAIPKGDANLKRQTKKDRLIYSSPGLDAATQSNAGAVSASADVGADTRGGTPTSDKSSGSSTSSVAQRQENSKKIIDKDNNPTAADDSIFGSQEEADAELLAELGIDPNETDANLTAPEGIENTAAERERLEKELMDELNKISANPVFNPKIYTLALKLGMTYVKDGINTAKKLVAKLNAMFGDKISPWAPAIVETINTWPKGIPFNEQQVMKFSKAVGARYEKGMTSLDDIQKDMEKLLKGQHKTFAPVIEASYNGIKKFFDTKEGISHAEQRSESTGKSTADGHSDLESGTVRGADAERGAGSTGRDGGAGKREQAAQPRNETDNSGADGASGKSGGRSTKRMGSADDRTGNGAGRTESPVLNGDKPDEIPGSNYHIKRTTNQGAGGEKTKYKQNVDAIRLLKKLTAEDRNATPSEQDILANFNGWGSVKAAFSDDPKWAKENKELHEILTKEEYDAAARATNNAFYTSPEIISAMWKGLKHLGFTGGRILDPSMGNGNFFGIMPVEMMEKSNLYGVELDKLTAGIAKQLYQKADIKQGGFETTRLPDNFFDLAVSNIPFGSYKLTDPAYEKSSTGEKTGYLIHNYFFAKAMDKVRPGGLVAFITGPGTMQSSAGEANTLRLEMGRKADLVAAFKLPGEAFSKHAGTNITTDVLILQKRVEPKKPAPYAQKWQKVSEHVFGTGWSAQHTPLNEYYKAHPENMLGTPQLDTRYGGSERFSLEAKGKTAADISKSLTKAMGKLPKEIFAPVKGKEHSTVKATQTFLAEANSYDYAYSVKDGKAYQNIHGVNTPVPAKNQKIVTNFVKLRSALNSVLKAQIDPMASDKVLDKLRRDLNTAYDSFVKQHGYLNKPGNVSRLGDDPMYGQTASIEKYKESGGKIAASKTDIFTKRTVGAIREVTTAATPSDALAVSIAQHGRVDLPYMASLLSKTEADVIKSLEGTLYRNPVTDGYELAEEYLSGNVRAKLEQAKAAAKTDPAFKTNVEALEKVQPIDMTEHDVTPHLGAPWIPQEIITDFTEHMVGTPLEVYHDSITGTWSVSKNNIYRADRTAMNNKWGFNQDYDFRDLLEAMLGMKDVTIRKYDITEGKRIVDPDKTAAAAQKMEDIQKEFETWIWSDEGRKTSLLKTYNKLFNSEVERQYDGSALTFPGLVQHVKDKLYAHQKNVIWRIMQGGNTLIAHCVGAGKTWSMQIAGMEMKRVGLCRKPMYVVPNNVVEQFRKEFYETYPNAKLLVLTSKDLPQAKTNIEFEEKLDTVKRVKPKKGKAIKSGKETETQKRDRLTRRRAALSRIATEDWDGIIISHNLFANLPMSPEYYQNFYKEMVDELDAAIRETKGSMSKRDVTALENAKANLEEKLKRDISEDKKEIVIPFEELGVDQLFVDEADKFKNLAFHTSMTRLSGISSSGSKRAMDMYVKTRYLGETQKGRGVCFATGTPISNTMNEMFTMQRYLQPEKLKDLGMKYFDSWAAMFGSKKSEAEPEPNGNGFRMIDKLKFTNLRSLGAMFRSFADIKMPEDLPYLKRPKLKGGKRTVVVVKSSKAFDDFKKTLIDRVEAIRKKLVSPTKDNMLKLTSDFRNASMDMRLVDPSIPGSEAGAKINALADIVSDRYQNGADPKGAQLIFSDIGTPKTQKEKELDSETIDGEVNAESVTIYEEIKKALIKRGIPAEEIGFVHDAKNTKQRQKLFDKVRAGELRVFIGSTEMMGAGTNFQDHLIALHHFDCPWKPRDIEQREGRILRAGNKNPEVEIFSYVTEGSFDANMWDKVRYKQQMIDSVMHGDPSIDEMDDINSNASASFGDIEALAMDNPLMADKVKVDAKVARLQSLASTYNKERRSMQHELNLLPGKISALTDDIERIQKDVKKLIPTRGEAFSITIGKNTFTKRADAKTAWEAMNKAYTSTTSKKVGKIGGMDIHLMRDNSYVMVTADGVRHATSNTVQLVGHRAYFVGNSIESMEKAVNGGIKANLQIREEELKELEKREKGLTAQLKEPFSKHKELNEALAEQKRINDELDRLGNGDKKYSVSADNRLDNSDNLKDNVTRKITNNITITKDGSISIKLKYPVGRNESRNERIARRKKEVRDIDASLVGQGINSAYTNMLPQANKQYIDRCIAKGVASDSLAREYLALYNKELANYSESVSEERRILKLMLLKGAQLYAGRSNNDGAGNRRVLDGGDQQSLGRNREENQINGSRSEKDGFSNAKNSAEEGRLQTARAMDDFVEDIKDAIPNAKDIDVDGTRVTVTMANGSKAHFDVVDRIGLTAEEETRVRKENNLAPDMPIIINGSERVIRGEGFIQLARNGRLGTAAHEITHIAMDLYLTDKEKAAVNRGYAKTVKVTGREVDELFADDVRDMKLSRKRYQNYAKLIRKVLNGIEDLKYIYKHSFDAYKTMRKVRSGEVFERQPGQQSSGRSFAGENKQLDNSDSLKDNVANKVFDRYLNDGIMKMVKDTVAKEIGEHVNLADMKDPVARDEARDSLPYIKDMLGKFNYLKGQGKRQDYINRMAVKIEYARRCFDNDRRIRNADVRRMERMQTEGTVYRNDNEALWRNTRESGKISRPTRISNSVSGGKFGARAHFLKLYEEESRSEKDGFSDANFSVSPAQEEAPKNFLRKQFEKLGKSAGIKAGKIIVEEDGKTNSGNEINLKQYVFASPSRIAKKVAAFREFYNMGSRAMDVLTKNRSDYGRKLGEAFELVKNKEDRQTLNDILLSGDAEGVEFTKQELINDGINENVAEAYVRIRRLMTKAYRLVNEARRRPQVKTINKASDKQIQELQRNKFIDILRVSEDENGHKKVTYKEYANWEKTYTVDKETMDRFYTDPAMQILDVHKDGDEYTATVRESVPPVNKLTGYIPHFFHQYMIRVKDDEGKLVATIGSGRTEREAIQRAEAWLKDNELGDRQTIYIAPKTFDFTSVGMDEGQYAAVMGDKDYYKMMDNVAKNNDLTLAEAKELMKGSVRQKNRHRFFGNVMQRKGVAGFETDMGYILNHYFSSASRYHAMETEFKPQAINLYERLFGDFNQDAPTVTADYIKDYINDINGNPATLEKAINNALMKSKYFRKYVSATFGERAALRLTNSITGATTYMCLGYFNASSALLNLTQVINSAAYIGDASALVKCIAKGAHKKYSLHDMKILLETNVLNDIGLDSGSGYDMNRMNPKNLLGKINKSGMLLFKHSEGMIRRGTVLAAYEKAIKDGRTHDEAIEFAKEVNQKANFNYGVEDAPNIFRRGSILSQLALQFKKYGIKELEVMVDMLPTNSKTSRKQKMIFWGTYFLAAGLMGLPMLDFFDEWPFDGKLKLNVEACMMETAGDSPVGKALVKTALFGGLASTVGIDISNRAGLSDVIPTRPGDLAGAAISKTGSFISDMMKGDHASALRDVSPGLYNQYAAWIAERSTGKRGRANNTYDSFHDKVLRSMGFKSTNERIDSDISRIVTMRKTELTQEKQKAIDDYIDTPSTENYRRLKELGIKPKQVQDEREKKKQDRIGRTAKGMSKDAKKRNDRLMKFAE